MILYLVLPSSTWLDLNYSSADIRTDRRACDLHKHAIYESWHLNFFPALFISPTLATLGSVFFFPFLPESQESQLDILINCVQDVFSCYCPLNNTV